MAEENSVLQNAAGELVLSKEQDIYEQIGRLDRRLDSWQEALPDLNERLKRLEAMFPEAVEEVKKQTAKVREIQHGVDNVMKVSTRVEGEFLGRLQKLEAEHCALTSLLKAHDDNFKDAGVRLVNLECFQLHHPEEHAKVEEKIEGLETTDKLVNETIKDLCERLARTESSYNKMLDFTDQKLVRHDQRLAGLEDADKELREKFFEPLKLELKDVANQGFRHEMDMEFLKQSVGSLPPTKIQEVDVAMPTEENIRCAICVHASPEGMKYEISGYRVAAKGCRLLQPEEVLYFRGTKCKRFEERE